jgi:hypothetical protein
MQIFFKGHLSALCIRRNVFLRDLGPFLWTPNSQSFGEDSCLPPVNPALPIGKLSPVLTALNIRENLLIIWEWPNSKHKLWQKCYWWVVSEEPSQGCLFISQKRIGKRNRLQTFIKKESTSSRKLQEKGVDSDQMSEKPFCIFFFLFWCIVRSCYVIWGILQWSYADSQVFYCMHEMQPVFIGS